MQSFADIERAHRRKPASHLTMARTWLQYDAERGLGLYVLQFACLRAIEGESELLVQFRQDVLALGEHERRRLVSMLRIESLLTP